MSKIGVCWQIVHYRYSTVPTTTETITIEIVIPTIIRPYRYRSTGSYRYRKLPEAYVDRVYPNYCRLQPRSRFELLCYIFKKCLGSVSFSLSALGDSINGKYAATRFMLEQDWHFSNVAAVVECVFPCKIGRRIIFLDFDPPLVSTE